MQGYSRLLRDHQLQVEMHLPDIPHVTLLMVMPARIDLSQLPQRHAKLLPYQRQELIQAMGIGYARLCIQLVSRLMGMSSIWTLDDNLSDCWRLPFENFVSSGGQHSQPEPVSFDTVMKTIEQQVCSLVHHCNCLSWLLLLLLVSSGPRQVIRHCTARWQSRPKHSATQAC